MELRNRSIPFWFFMEGADFTNTNNKKNTSKQI